MNKIIIRPIGLKDSNSITKLTNQLGASILEEIILDQIEEILRNPDHYAFVAEEDNLVVGYVHCFNAIRLTSKPFTEICGLVVDENNRGCGIGKLLVQKVETLFTDNRKIRVRCNTKRELAHKFYLKSGYSLNKDQKIFVK